MHRVGTINRELSTLATEYPQGWYLLQEPFSRVVRWSLIEDPANKESPYLLEVPARLGLLATGWLIKADDNQERVVLERLTHPGKGDPRFISREQIASVDNLFIGQYIRAIFSA